MFLLEGHRGAVRALDHSPDGTQLVSGGEDGTVFLWDLKERQSSVELFSHVSTPGPSTIETICWERGDWITLGCGNGGITRLPLPVDQTRTSKTFGPIAATRCIREFRQGEVDLLLTHSWDGGLIWRDPESLEVVESQPMVGLVKSLAISGDRTVALVATQDGSVRRYGPSGWQQSRFLTDGRGVQCIACDPLVRHFALANQAGSLFVFRTGPPFPELVLTLSHASVVYGLAFTPDGRRLVSGGADGTVRIWDIHTGEQLHVFEWHRKWVTCLAMSPDGTTVATGSEDSTIAVWDVPD